MNEYRDKVAGLFTYLREFSAANQKIVLNLNNQIWHQYFSDLPTYKNYVYFEYRDKTDNDEDYGDSDGIILSVKQPDFFPCPHKPAKLFSGWLNFDWQNYKSTPAVIAKGIRKSDGTVVIDPEMLYRDPDRVETFGSNEEREQKYQNWLANWNSWVEEQKKINEVNELFIDLYKKYKELETDSETKELLCGTGILQIPGMPEVNHPILLKRLKMVYDSQTNTISLRDTTAKSEIYTLLLSTVRSTDENAISPEGIKKLTEILEAEDYHPLDRIGTMQFFERTVSDLNQNGIAVPSDASTEDEDIKEINASLYLSEKPVLLIRRRISGAVNAIQKIIDDVEQGSEIPQILFDIVGKYEPYVEQPVHELTPVQKLAEIGGEDPELLLPLPANSEQLQIARRIETEPAVIVQGPPGTGKTHTIANLLGNFLSQGKSVLVTSDTRKALTVLKDMVPADLQALCVSLLDEDNKDMESSIEGISTFISQHTSHEVKQKMESSIEERNYLIKELSVVREKIHTIREKEYKPVRYQGKAHSLTEVAQFVNNHKKELGGVIPGAVKKREELPLSYDEFTELYTTNTKVTEKEENILINGIPYYTEFPDAASIRDVINRIKNSQQFIVNAAKSIGYDVDDSLVLSGHGHTIQLKKTTKRQLLKLKETISSGLIIDAEWKKKAIADGKKGGEYNRMWYKLMSDIREADTLSSTVYVEHAANPIELASGTDLTELNSAVMDIYNFLSETDNPNWFQKRKFKKQYSIVDKALSVNGEALSTFKEYQDASNFVDLLIKRSQLEQFWNSLIGDFGGTKFSDLQAFYPEQQAVNYIPVIKQCLSWYTVDYDELSTRMKEAGLDPKEVFVVDPLKSDDANLQSIFDAFQNTLPVLIQIQEELLNYDSLCITYNTYRKGIAQVQNRSGITSDLLSAFDHNKLGQYADTLNNLRELNGKVNVLQRRYELLNKLKVNAPVWATAISVRNGIHGRGTVPHRLEEAWQWKQYELQLKESNKFSLNELQEKSKELSVRYRIATTEAAKWAAWYHLLKKIESNKYLAQSLEGWRQTMKRIGKGTGKRAAAFKQEARKQMKVCQNAVPVWIMTMNQVFDILTPGDNKYDVVIVDEASQSNITALAIAYYGAKIIIVGDDKQVSPLAIGTDDEKIHALTHSYLSKDIPNRHLYTTRTSLYDIAATTFKPLMLYEHFRCVPEIIGYSNMLSYDYKIRPLRDKSSTNLTPAIISWNVHGRREDARSARVNKTEQDYTVALLKAMFAMPEYQDKTMGVITLLGDRQALEIQSRLSDDPAILEKHNVLFGNSAQFQGDERDVIILNMVDSNEGNSSLRLLGEGGDDVNIKRYNVAVSRARDQLWIIHSLDREKDLKEGDLRKTLLDYAEDPFDIEKQANSEKESSSPFEKEVAAKLMMRGYKVVQQYPVGSYYVDLVVMDEHNKVAIECDGDRWGIGAAKIQQDMERQTILERVGWTFIRIRGSEYYYDPDKAIKRVMRELSRAGVRPTEADVQAHISTNALRNAVIGKVREYLREYDPIRYSTIADEQFKEPGIEDVQKPFIRPLKPPVEETPVKEEAKKPAEPEAKETKAETTETAVPAETAETKEETAAVTKTAAAETAAAITPAEPTEAAQTSADLTKAADTAEVSAAAELSETDIAEAAAASAKEAPSAAKDHSSINELLKDDEDTEADAEEDDDDDFYDDEDEIWLSEGEIIFLEMLDLGCKCYLDKETDRVYVLFDVCSASNAQGIVSEHDYSITYKNLNSSPVQGSAAFIIHKPSDKLNNLKTIKKEMCIFKK